MRCASECACVWVCMVPGSQVGAAGTQRLLNGDPTVLAIVSPPDPTRKGLGVETGEREKKLNSQTVDYSETVVYCATGVTIRHSAASPVPGHLASKYSGKR
ncbi:hypothetical protein Bbelb_294870 [Branchiostoma belcheri]|nr:hypothetical protein Bbelb_294870 [Branchiostoma belcheri]